MNVTHSFSPIKNDSRKKSDEFFESSLLIKSKKPIFKENRYDILFLEGEDFLRQIFASFSCIELPIESDLFLIQIVLSSILEINKNKMIVLKNLLDYSDAKLKNEPSSQKDRMNDFIDKLTKLPYPNFSDILLDENRIKQDLAELSEIQKCFNLEQKYDKNFLTMLKDQSILIADINFEIQNDNNQFACIHFPIQLKKKELLSFTDSSSNAQEKCVNLLNKAYCLLGDVYSTTLSQSKNINEIKTKMYHSEKALYSILLENIDDVAECFLDQLDYYNQFHKCIINKIALDIYSTHEICPDCEIFFSNPWEELAECLISRIKIKYPNVDLVDKLIHKNMIFTQTRGRSERNEFGVKNDDVLNVDRGNPRFWANNVFLKNRYELNKKPKKQYYLSRPRTYFVSEPYFPSESDLSIKNKDYQDLLVVINEILETFNKDIMDFWKNYLGQEKIVKVQVSDFDDINEIEKELKSECESLDQGKINYKIVKNELTRVAQNCNNERERKRMENMKKFLKFSIIIDQV